MTCDNVNRSNILTCVVGCGEGYFSCNDNNASCIDPAVVCDSYYDCDNSIDEADCYSSSRKLYSCFFL